MEKLGDMLVGALILLGPVFVAYTQFDASPDVTASPPVASGGVSTPPPAPAGAGSPVAAAAAGVAASGGGNGNGACGAADGTRVFLPEEIAPFDGTHPSGKILLVVMGQVGRPSLPPLWPHRPPLPTSPATLRDATSVDWSVQG